MQSEHKIQSGKGSLHIEMDQVPKILKPLVSEWTREGYIVSFKVRLFAIPVIDFPHQPLPSPLDRSLSLSCLVSVHVILTLISLGPCSVLAFRSVA